MTSPRTALLRRRALLWLGLALVGSLVLLGSLGSQTRIPEAAPAPSVDSSSSPETAADTSLLPATAAQPQPPEAAPSRSKPSAPAATVTTDEADGLEAEYGTQNWSDHVTDVTHSGGTTVVETDLEDLGQTLPAGVTLSRTVCLVEGYGLEDGQVVQVRGTDGTHLATVQFEQC